MCVIIAGLSHHLPTEDEFDEGAYNNPHGFGWGVIWDDGAKLRLTQGKTLDKNEGLDTLPNLVESLGPKVVAWAWHARIATSGGVNLQGCHPHKIPGDKRTVLFHNGILPLAPADGISDTATFARDVIPAMGGTNVLNNNTAIDLIEEWSSGSKLVFLSANPNIMPITILNEQDGIWVDDLWYSNSSCWAPKVSATLSVGAWDIDDLDSIEIDADELWSDGLCEGCNEPVDRSKSYCTTCYCCLDCGNWDCSCSLTTAGQDVLW